MNGKELTTEQLLVAVRLSKERLLTLVLINKFPKRDGVRDGEPYWKLTSIANWFSIKNGIKPKVVIAKYNRGRLYQLFPQG